MCKACIRIHDADALPNAMLPSTPNATDDGVYRFMVLPFAAYCAVPNDTASSINFLSPSEFCVSARFLYDAKSNSFSAAGLKLLPSTWLSAIEALNVLDDLESDNPAIANATPLDFATTSESFALSM